MNAKETVLESQEDFGKLLVESGKALLVEVSSLLWIQRTACLIEKRIEFSNRPTFQQAISFRGGRR